MVHALGAESGLVRAPFGLAVQALGQMLVVVGHAAQQSAGTRPAHPQARTSAKHAKPSVASTSLTTLRGRRTDEARCRCGCFVVGVYAHSLAGTFRVQSAVYCLPHFLVAFWGILRV